MLWAWDRPEDLRFLAGSRTAVAALAGTVTLSGDQILATPRHHPVILARETLHWSVVRLEFGERPPHLDARQLDRTLAAILELAPWQGARGLQIDFDATASARDFYRRLLIRLRQRLAGDLELGMTALASWCLGDPWLDGLPIDHAVPMLFRMGIDGPGVARHLRRGGRLRAGFCRQSLGLSTDEAWPRTASHGQVFLFHPEPWSAASVDAALDRLQGTG